MNEIKSSEFGFNQPKPVSSAPQVQSSEADKAKQVIAEAVNTVQKSGKSMPQDAQQTAEAKSVEVKEAVSKLNEYVQSTQRNLDFQLDDESGKTVIRVYDRQSEQLVRQIPDEVALELAKSLNGDEPLMLFNAQV
ncbi:flagellar protein FlaG [Bermanella marisrubri]|uniref:Uncharacterized flagellar protein FlaG n=1 Tax=Bermanella marisrubri TaxID=207949 RepID=Q1N2Y2_9GAMM|nr:flagellar protein FlaG [Bermanella marisrubri]EAT12537.1 uncharacterized flagellar protein FlaG [Oceanobacter sp. RED65] [Bermanella marisrubri]QIZ84905.1 flagellar protein FlaG [Bermanella marisrubri]